MPSMQVRRFWPFNRRTPDWSSHLDPHYHRFHRQRNLATRAKLLKSIRRGNKWDLGGDHELFFSPRHARLASHYNGAGGHKRWRRDTEQEVREEQEDGDSHELSSREKAWKEHMERVRKRIDVDPYEAIFGRRFQPFWAPLMPNWGPDAAATDSVNPKDTKADIKQSDQKPESTAYAYSRSTSWDSWTNTAKGTEWDSLSGETKHYEYDPITNRMVQIVKEPAPAQDLASQRKAIPIPQFAASESTSNIDGLTASSIRASMGKPKSQDHHQIAALLQESAPKKSASSSWDHAEQYCMLEQQLQSLQVKKDGLADEQRRTFHYADIARRHKQLDDQMSAVKNKLQVLNEEQIHMATTSVNEPVAKPLTTALQRGATASKKVTESPLRPAVDRMQSKPALDMDDSAAHESTEPAASTVPKAWADQASLLQTDRVKRTTSKMPYPSPVPKWVDEMAARQEAAANDTAAHERAAKLAKTDALLQAEILRQKLVMQSQEERSASSESVKRPAAVKAEQDTNTATVEAKYKAKLAAMKEELNLAYQQSSRHADEFRNQISKVSQRSEDVHDLEAKYKAKLASMKENLDIAYKQSAKHADEFNKQVQQLSNQLKRAKSEHTPASKAPASATQQALVKEIRGIYEQAYGVIGQESESTPAMKDALAGFDKMTAYEGSRSSTGPVKEVDNAYAFQKDNLETELAPAASPAKAINSVYDFKDDGLEQELAPSASPAKAVNSVYDFKDDGLEQELAPPTSSARAMNNVYDFKDDGLEQELAASPLSAKAIKPQDPLEQELAKFSRPAEGQSRTRKQETLEQELAKFSRPTEKQTHTSKQATLEHELAKFSHPTAKTEDAVRPEKGKLYKKDLLVKNANTGVYRFRNDSLEAELKAKAEPMNQELTDLDAKSYDFKEDNLEAELSQRWRTMKRNGMPWRQRIAELKEVSKMVNEVKHGRPVNPVDGTVAPVTGNYASPTGFVRFDDPVTDGKHSGKSGASYKQDHPRVKREEAVFTGTRRVHGAHDMSKDGGRRARRRQRRAKKIFKTLGLITVLSFGGAYIYGMQIENSEMKRLGGQEAWAKMAQKYEQGGERGIAEAIKEMKQTDPKWAGLFWK